MSAEMILRSGTGGRQFKQVHWRPDELDPVEVASVRRPIWNMNAWLSTGGVVPAE
jgi:hypothetical protein